MQIPWWLVFIIGGLILNSHPAWFAGAATVGTILFWFGIFLVALWLIVIIVALAHSGRW